MRSVTKFPSLAIGVGLLALGIGMVGCRSSETRNRGLLETGNKYYNSGKYREASLIYRKLLQKDARYGEAYYRLALTDLRQGQIPSAIRSFRRACELQPNNEDAHVKLGDLHLAIYLANPQKNKAQLKEFSELADTMLKRNPKSYDGLRLRGYQNLGEGKVKDAITAFSQANAIKPDQPGLVLVLAQAMAGDNRGEESEKLVRSLLEREKAFGPGYDYLYVQYLRLQRLPEAEAVLKLKIANNPKSSDYILQMADFFMRLRKTAEMRATLEKITSNSQDFPNGWMLVGDYFYRVRDFEQALSHFQKGVQSQPDKKLAYEKRIVECLVAQDKRAEAVKLAQSLTESYPGDPEAKALRAALRLQSSHRREVQTAITELQSAVTRLPENAVIRFRLGEALLSKGEMDQARLQFEEAVKLRPGYLAPKYALGQIYLSKKDYPKASALAEEVLAFSPVSVQARLLRASALIGMGDRPKARTALEELLKIDAKVSQAAFLLAGLDLVEQRYQQAEEGFRLAYTATPPDLRGLQGLVEVYMAQNKAPQAQKLVEDEIRKSPDSMSLRMALASVAMRTKQFDVAIREYSTIRDRAPNAPENHFSLGEAYRLAGKYTEAAASFQKVRDLAPNDPTGPMYLALVFEATGERTKAKPLYEQVLKLAPDNIIALNNLAFLLAESIENLDQALSYAQRAKQQQPQNLDVADTLGWIYIRKNLSDQAIDIFRDLVTKRPEHVTWRYHLAMALYQKGDKPRARKELEAALKNGPNKEEEGKIRDLLAKTGA